MPKSKFIRYTTFGSLYFTQGTILGFFAALNALYLLDNGLQMTDVGIFGLIALLPFVLKIGLGIISDRINLLGMGHRKPYIYIGLAVQFLCLLAAPFINPGTNFWGYVALAFTMQLGMALYDTCTDGLALDTTPVEEHGTIQGFMVGGRAVGSIIAATVVGFLAENVSWLAVFWVLAALTFLPIPFMLFVHEDQREVEKRFEWSAFKAFNKTTYLAGVLGLIMFMIILGANQLVNPYLEANFSQITLSQIGMITSLWGLGVVGGSFVGGWLMRQLTAKRALIIGVFLLCATLLTLAYLISPQYSLTLAIGVIIFFGIAYGTYQTQYFAVAMRFVDPRIAASMYAILMAFTNVGQGIGMYLSGSLADLTGFSLTFVILFGLNLLILPLLGMVFKPKHSATGMDAG
jgi:PAT family beta-lactamase induction signal transducer AmpG